MAQQPFDLDSEFLRLSPHEDSFISFRQATTGVFIVGRTGSGKSATAIKACFNGVIRSGGGALVLIPKEEDIAEFVRMCKEAGRGGDVRLFAPGGQWCMDIISHTAMTAPVPSMAPQEINNTLNIALEIQALKNNDSDNFFGASAAQLASRAAGLIMNAGKIPTLQHIDAIINSLPRSPDALTEEFLDKTECGIVIKLAKQRADAGQMTESEYADWFQRHRYFQKRIPHLAKDSSATLESILATYETTFTPLLEGAVRDLLLAPKPNYYPEQAFEENHIVILGLPTKTYGYSAQAIQKMCKYVFLKARERWAAGADKRGDILPFGVFCDEYQEFCSPSIDPLFLGTLRSSKTVFVAATQSLPSLTEKLTPQKAEAQLGAILTNLNTRIALNLSDTYTADYLADDIGKVYTNRVSTSIGDSTDQRGQGSQSTGYSIHEDYRHIITPLVFKNLIPASPDTGAAECIIWHHGKLWQEREESNVYMTAFDFNGRPLTMPRTQQQSERKGWNLFGRKG